MAYLYLIPFNDGLMKFGISENVINRINTHKKQYPVNESGILVYQSTTKRVALVERLIKTEVKFNKTNHDGKDGYTEICDISNLKRCKQLASILGKPIKYKIVRNYGIEFSKPLCVNDIRANIDNLSGIKKKRNGKLFVFESNINDECMHYFQYIEKGKIIGLTSFTEINNIVIMAFSECFVL